MEVVFGFGLLNCFFDNDDEVTAVSLGILVATYVGLALFLK